MHGREVFVVDAVRTPVGRLGGALARVRPDDLGAVVIRALLARTPSLDPALIGEVLLGAANQAGEDNRNVARMSSLLAGLPTSVPGSTVNRLCASGLDAVVSAARTIAVGDASVMVAGGVESMSRAPWVVPKPERAFPVGDSPMASTTLGWRLVNPAMPADWTLSLGACTELLGEKYGITREQADAFAVRSQERAARAWAEGAYAGAVVQVEGAELDRDEGIRDGVSVESLAPLDAVLPRRRHRHRGQRLPALRRRGGPAAGRRGRAWPSSASSRWPGSPRPAWTGWTRSTSASARSGPSTARWRRPGAPTGR